MQDLLNFFISASYAESLPQAAEPASGGLSFVLMFVIFFFLIYFTFWRPQNRRAKEQQNLLSSLARGDEVITAGGILGRITKLNDQYITIAVANNFEVVVQKSSVVNILPKGTLKALE